MKISREALEILLNDAANRDRTTARRTTLFKILYQERYLTRDQLIARVEARLGKGCFGVSAWIDTFFRDMQVVKQAMCAAGYQLAYRRGLHQPGYYLRDQPSISVELSVALDGSVAEVDPAQIAILKKLSFQQRFQQGCSTSNLASRVVANRIRQKKPELSLAEAHRLAVQKRAA